jgi:glyceraldehyde-3-phosphate dehydrogenase/erythrose-4-phosphate dehydrogenase
MNARRINIRRGDLVCIRNGSGAMVAVERGTAWLTQDDDRRDVVLEAGGSFRLDRGGVAVVSAFTAAELAVTAPAGGSLPAIETSSRATRPFAGAGRLALGF